MRRTAIEEQVRRRLTKKMPEQTLRRTLVKLCAQAPNLLACLHSPRNHMSEQENSTTIRAYDKHRMGRASKGR